MSGRAIKETFYLIAQPAITSYNTPNLPEYSHGCCSDQVLKVLADDTGIDLQNDKSGFLWWFPDLITSAVLKLQKYESGWTDKLTLTADNTLGTAYDYGFFTNDELEKFVGYQLEWANVLDIYGEGSYRIKCVTTDFAAVVINLYSDEYCLKTYTPARANGTVRIEYYLNGVLGLNNDDKKFKDLGTLDWYNAFRLGGFFGFPTASYAETRTIYETGERHIVSHEQEPEFTLKLKPQPFFVHEYLRTDVMMADTVFISDYNNKNVNNYVQKEVYANQNFEPNWNKLVNQLASIEIKFKQKYNNHRKLIL